MLDKKQIKEILKVGFTLFAITAVSALVLAFVNSVTEPVIAKNTAEKEMLAMQKVLPGAFSFLDENLVNDKTDKSISAIYEGRNTSNETTGYSVMVTSYGYGGAIAMAVGVNIDLEVTGIDIISQSETPSLGVKCTEDSFKEQFIGKTAGIKVSKKGAKENEIDAISSATVTSKAVTGGVNKAIDAVTAIKEGK